MTQDRADGRGPLQAVAREFTTVAWVLIPIGIGLNVVGGMLVNVLRLPLFLDAIGTILVAVLAGPWVGAATGGLTNLILGLVTVPTMLPYALTNIAIGLVAGYMARAGWFRTIPKVAGTGVAIMVAAIIVSAPITAYLFGGVTGTGTDVVRAFFLATGRTILEAVLLESLISESVDKLISVFVAFALARSIPQRYRPENAHHTLPA
jgi:energy-coupling factor transport system substrate-specific component